MINVYYTGAVKHLGEQTDPSLSLGGYISSNLIYNDYFGNIFPEITVSSIAQKSTYSSVLAVANETSPEQDITNLTLTIATTPNNQGRFKGAIVSQSIDSCGDPIFQLLNSPQSTPTNTPLQNITSFYGYVPIAFNRIIQEGELVEIFDNGSLVVEFAYESPNFDDVEILNDNYYIERVFDYETEKYNLNLVQKDLDNYSNLITFEIEGEDVTGALAHVSPVINRASLALLEGGKYAGLFIQRSIDRQITKLREKQLCERLYSEFVSEIDKQTDEVIELIVEYDDIP